jgi:flagellin-like protein
MKQNIQNHCIRKITPAKKRAVAEVISSLLLVAITVVGAVILTTFLDEAFISGGLAASGSDSTIKTLKLIKYDSRDGGNLMGLTDLNNTSIAYPKDNYLCRESCPFPNTSPDAGGTAFLVIQIENQSVNPIFLHNVWLGNTTHSWDLATGGVPLDALGYPGDGKFSIFPTDCNIGATCDSSDPSLYRQFEDNQIQSGQTVNLLVKLDNSNPDIPLGKTIRTQFNIGANQLSEFLITSGGAQ